MIWQFDDGGEGLDMDGDYRVVLRGEKLYVVGQGLLSRVTDMAEGERFIRVLKGEEAL